MLFTLLAAAIPARAQHYKALSLHPAGALHSQANAISQGRQVGAAVTSAYLFRAATWSGTADSLSDVTPSAFHDAWLNGTSGEVHVGTGLSATWDRHAFRLSGGKFADLNPPAFRYSEAWATSGSVHVGGGQTDNNIAGYHALEWRETALGPAPLDIHPAAYTSSMALATNGVQHAGFGRIETASADLGEEPPSLGAILTDPGMLLNWISSPSGFSFSVGERPHALAWLNSGATIDLHPAGVWGSTANAMSGSLAAGGFYGRSGYWQAMVWPELNPTTAVLLNTGGLHETLALGTNGALHVGEGRDDDYRSHALLWTSNDAVPVDLNSRLPDGLNEATATAVDGDGNIVGYAWSTYGEGYRAMLWKPLGVGGSVPEAPRNLSASSPADGGIQLEWEKPAGSVTRYNVYRGLLPGREQFFTSVAGNARTYHDRATLKGMTYYYQLTAVNDSGQSPRSIRVSATAQ
jgi:hypothetical protein